MTANHTSTRETILPLNPNPSPKKLFPNPTPTRPRKNQTGWRNGNSITTQPSTKIRSHYWHTIPPAGRAMKNPVRMIFCCSEVSCRRNNGSFPQIFGDLIGEAVAAVRVPVVGTENSSNSSSRSSSRTKIRIRLHRNGRGWEFPKKTEVSCFWLSVAWKGEGSNCYLYIFCVCRNWHLVCMYNTIQYNTIYL